MRRGEYAWLIIIIIFVAVNTFQSNSCHRWPRTGQLSPQWICFYRDFLESKRRAHLTTWSASSRDEIQIFVAVTWIFPGQCLCNLGIGMLEYLNFCFLNENELRFCKLFFRFTRLYIENQDRLIELKFGTRVKVKVHEFDFCDSSKFMQFKFHDF